MRKRFTGYEKDAETGLDFAEARYYQNAHSRFTAVDPLLASGKSAQKSVDKNKELTYEEVVALAFENPPTGENILITVNYRRGQGNKPEGSLAAGDPAVRLRKG